MIMVYVRFRRTQEGYQTITAKKHNINLCAIHRGLNKQIFSKVIWALYTSIFCGPSQFPGAQIWGLDLQLLRALKFFVNISRQIHLSIKNYVSEKARFV